MAVKVFSKQTPETKPPHSLQSESLELVTIVINLMIGGFS